MKKYFSFLFLCLIGIFMISCSSQKVTSGENEPNNNGLENLFESLVPSTKDESLEALGDAAYGGIMGNINLVSPSIRGEGYNEIVETGFVETGENDKTYFTLDSNSGSYANLRRYINSGKKLNKDVIKTDELINYFKYDLGTPEDGKTFKIVSDMMVCPWNEENFLVTIGVASKEEKLDESIKNNLVFLIDVSGSMYSKNKLDLLKEAFPLMLDSLNPDDIISIVTYASGTKVALEACRVSEKETIIDAINSLKAGGSTAGAAGLNLAYQTASSCFIEGGNNRIILATDGDFNVGPSSIEALKELVAEKRASGIYLSVLGVGMGNYQDKMVETLAMNGNGNYAYIDSLVEAKKVLSEELTTTLISVAKDVKVEVDFNSDFVESYRVIGYENKRITQDDFNDETKDASEIGSGHTTVVTYEIKLRENISNLNLQDFELLKTTINFKDPKTDKSYSESDVFTFNEVNLNNISEDSPNLSPQNCCCI